MYCYFWTKSDAQLGAIEIGSCIWEYLKALCDDDDNQKEVIFYSDNCCKQNKYIDSIFIFVHCPDL